MFGEGHAACTLKIVFVDFVRDCEKFRPFQTLYTFPVAVRIICSVAPFLQFLFAELLVLHINICVCALIDPSLKYNVTTK